MADALRKCGASDATSSRRASAETSNDAPPFEVIARKFATTPEMLAFSLLDPHPRMNVTVTRREARHRGLYQHARQVVDLAHPAFELSAKQDSLV
jgi:hypothetical protein